LPNVIEENDDLDDMHVELGHQEIGRVVTKQK